MSLTASKTITDFLTEETTLPFVLTIIVAKYLENDTKLLHELGDEGTLEINSLSKKKIKKKICGYNFLKSVDGINSLVFHSGKKDYQSIYDVCKPISGFIVDFDKKDEIFGFEENNDDTDLGLKQVNILEQYFFPDVYSLHISQTINVNGPSTNIYMDFHHLRCLATVHLESPEDEINDIFRKTRRYKKLQQLFINLGSYQCDIMTCLENDLPESEEWQNVSCGCEYTCGLKVFKENQRLSNSCKELGVQTLSGLTPTLLKYIVNLHTINLPSNRNQINLISSMGKLKNFYHKEKKYMFFIKKYLIYLDNKEGKPQKYNIKLLELQLAHLKLVEKFSDLTSDEKASHEDIKDLEKKVRVSKQTYDNFNKGLTMFKLEEKILTRDKETIMFIDFFVLSKKMGFNVILDLAENNIAEKVADKVISY